VAAVRSGGDCCLAVQESNGCFQELGFLPALVTSRVTRAAALPLEILAPTSILDLNRGMAGQADFPAVNTYPRCPEASPYG